MGKKLSVIAVSVALVSMMFSGCSKPQTDIGKTDTGKTSSSDKDTKKVSGKIIWCSHRTDFANTIIPKYIEEFKKQYPGVEIQPEQYKDYKDTIKIKMSSDDMPDVLGLGGGDYTRDQMQANLAPLDELPVIKDFSGLDPFKGNDGKTYSLPSGLGATGVVYNKKIFKELNIAVPKTQDEFIAAAKKITDSGKVGLATSAKAKWPLQYYWGAIPRTISGDTETLNKYATQDEPFTKDSAVVKGWEMLKKWSDAKIIEKDPLSADWEPMKKEFRAGNVGMFLLGNWFIPQAVGEALTEADIGFFPLPYDNDSGPKNVEMGPDYGWSMSQKSKSPELQKAFFNFLVDTKYADWAKETGLLSARSGVTVDMPFVTEFESFKPKKIFAPADSKELNDIVTKIQFDRESFAQQVIAGQDFDKLIADLNKKWKSARGK